MKKKIDDTWLPVGRRVLWESQASGSSKTKVGVIRAHIPAGTSQMRAQRLAEEFPNTGFSVYGLTGFSSSPHRYLVEVKRTGAKGQPLKSKWYTPRKNTVDQQNVDPHNRW